MQKRALLVILLSGIALNLWSAPVVMTVPATSNIFRAGTDRPWADTTPSGQGTIPIQYPGALPPGPNPLLVLYFPNMTGGVNYTGGGAMNGPDGLDTSPSGNGTLVSTSISSLNGIAGISKTNTVMFLVGVFMGGGNPGNRTGPAANNFDNANSRVNFDNLVLGQTFFIGDGRTSTGQLQRFYVPNGATRLYLGFADSSGFNTGPGWYGDNNGSFSVTADFGNPSGGGGGTPGGVPEPGTIGLVSMALLGLGLRLRKRG